MSGPNRTGAAGGRRRGDRGAVIPLVALILPVLLIFTAFAVDLGRQRSARRTMQAGADVIALDLARLIDGRTEAQILADPATQAAVVASAARNDIERAKITYDFGRWVDTTGGAGVFEPVLGDVRPDAVRVRAQDEIDYFFRPGTGGADRAAVASNARVAGFQIGSKLATVNTSQAQLLNGLLGDALNTNLNLSAATYQGLAGSTINLGRLATQMGFGSPDELAEANVSAREFFLASADVLEQDGQTAAANVFNVIGAQTDEDAVLDMGQVFQVAAGGGRDAAVEAGLDAFNVLTGSAYAINGTNTISIPNINLTVPNVTSTGVSVTAVERPRAIFGPVGTSIQTQQADVWLANALTTAGVPLVGGLLRVTGEVVLHQSVAGAIGTLTDIACGAPPGISVGVTPQPVAVTADLKLSIRTVGILGIPGIEVATVNVGLSATPVGQSAGGSFDYTNEFLPPVGTGTMLEAPTSPLGLSNLLTVRSTDVVLLGVLPVPLPDLVTGLNTTLLNPILSNLDTALTGPVATALGLSLGAADIGALDMTCDSVRLVG